MRGSTRVRRRGPSTRVVVACAALVVLTAGTMTLSSSEARAYSGRRLVLAIGEPGSKEFRTLERLVVRARCRLVDRDVDVVFIDAVELETLREGRAEPASPSVRRALDARDPDTRGFELVLVGKDGGVKARAREPDALAEFLERIDTMPMRRAEMRRAGEPDADC